MVRKAKRAYACPLPAVAMKHRSSVAVLQQLDMQPWRSIEGVVLRVHCYSIVCAPACPFTNAYTRSSCAKCDPQLFLSRTRRWETCCECSDACNNPATKSHGSGTPATLLSSASMAIRVHCSSCCRWHDAACTGFRSAELVESLRS